ncbi:MAG: DUF192 domain-containing protein [Candidatus Pacearchaeota archaeon]
MKKISYTLSITIIIIILLMVIIFNHNNFWLKLKTQNEKISEVCFEKSGNCFKIETADSDEERERGLMFKEFLNENKGMLFIFPQEGKYKIWMKNTLIPLDILWISKNHEVIHIIENARPCDGNLCEIYSPNNVALYVLEINSGIVKKLGVEIGDKISFN